MKLTLLNGPPGSGKTAALADLVTEALHRERSDTCLVLCRNAFQRNRLRRQLLDRLSVPLSDLPVYTYSGWVRYQLQRFWPLSEARIQQAIPSAQQSVVQPLLSGLDEAEFLLRVLLVETRRENPLLFNEVKGSDKSLLNQLMRRFRLRAEHGLTRQQMYERSVLLQQPDSAALFQLEKRFDQVSYQLRLLDTNKQLETFQGLMQADQSPLLAWHHQTLKHVWVDEVDEATAAEWAFLRQLWPSLSSLSLAGDAQGGARRGYLNAHPRAWQQLITRPDVTVQPLEPPSCTSVQAAQALRERVFGGLSLEGSPTPWPAGYLNPTIEARTQIEQLDDVRQHLQRLVESGVPLTDVALVTPSADAFTISAIHFALAPLTEALGVPLQPLSGTQRPADQPTVQALLTLLQCMNLQRWRLVPSYQALLGVLRELLLPRLPEESLPSLTELEQQATHWLTDLQSRLAQGECSAGEQQLALTQGASDLDAVLHSAGDVPSSPLQDTLADLRDWLERQTAQPLSQQLLNGLTHWVYPVLDDTSSGQPYAQVLRSYERQAHLAEGLGLDPLTFEWQWLWQQQTGASADTVDSPMEADPTALVLGTPQKLIDLEVRRPHQVWLNTRHPDWARTDDAPLYNAWVQSADYQDESLEQIEAQAPRRVRERAAHLLGKLLAQGSRTLTPFEAECDWDGTELQGSVPQWLMTDSHAMPMDSSAISFEMLERATLRPEQAPILAYQTGTLAVSAVPGAGKTFVTVELLLELMSRGVEPTSILVLTYMDSAAQTLLQRLKAKLKPLGLTRFPAVSTIHSLAYRLLQEAPDWLGNRGIIDEQQREQLLRQAAYETLTPQLEQEVGNGENWLKALTQGINHAKSQRLTPEVLLHQKTKPLLLALGQAFQRYEALLAEQQALDFNDLILQAVQLLESNETVLQKVQQRYQYVIEDEAQDSSLLLQQLLTLIGGEQPNIIRVGDSNQSITTTFSSADTTVFRNFIQRADQIVVMDKSARCAGKVMTLANGWVKACLQSITLREAFTPTYLSKVDGANPELAFPIEQRRFDTQHAETQWMIERIEAIRSAQPDTSIAVLVPTNQLVNDLTFRLQEAGLPAVNRSDTLQQAEVFQLLMAWLRVLQAPHRPEMRQRLYSALQQAAVLNAHEHPAALQQQLRDYLTFTPLFQLQAEALPQSDWPDGAQQFIQVLHTTAQAVQQDWLQNDLPSVLMKLTQRFFSTVSQRSNGYWCALLAYQVIQRQRLQPQSTSQTLMERSVDAFEELVRRQRSKAFADLLEDSESGGRLEVLTLHKSKGQEFDVVFMPGLTQRQFPHQPEQIRLEAGDKLQVLLDSLEQPASFAALRKARQQAVIEEKARLLYVGLTRAKQGLFLSCFEQAKSGRSKPQQPAWLLDVLASGMQAEAVN